MASINEQFHKKIGEYGYSATMISQMFTKLGLSWRSGSVLYYAKKNDLFISVEDLNMPARGSSTKHLLPQSRLLRLIKDLRIPVTGDDLERAAGELRYNW